VVGKHQAIDSLRRRPAFDITAPRPGNATISARSIRVRIRKFHAYSGGRGLLLRQCLETGLPMALTSRVAPGIERAVARLTRRKVPANDRSHHEMLQLNSSGKISSVDFGLFAASRSD